MEIKSGVYLITSVVNGVTYVGSAVNLKRRMTRHYSELRKNIHYNKRLQRNWNKYGETSIEYTIIEECDPLEVRNVEQFYVDYFKSIGVDVCNVAVVDVTRPQLGNIVSEETRKKLSDSNKGRKLSDAQKLNLSIKVKALWQQKEYREKYMETCRKRTKKERIKKGPNPDANSKTYHFVFNGEDVVVFNLAKFCRDSGIKEEKLRDVAAGRRRSHKGYTRKS